MTPWYIEILLLIFNVFLHWIRQHIWRWFVNFPAHQDLSLWLECPVSTHGFVTDCIFLTTGLNDSLIHCDIVIDFQCLPPLDQTTCLGVIWQLPRPPRPFPVVGMSCVNTWVCDWLHLCNTTKWLPDTLQYCYSYTMSTSIGSDNMFGGDLSTCPPTKTFPRGWNVLCQHMGLWLTASS
jgi:hypothetical protein